MTLKILGAVCDLVPFVQIKKCEKHPCRSVNSSIVAGFSCNFTESNSPPWVFFTFFKLYKWHQIAQSIRYVLDISLIQSILSNQKIMKLLENIAVIK